jgi:hypothetical protein
VHFGARKRGVEVNGQTVLSLINGMEARSVGWLAEKLLRENGIGHPEPGKWYSQKAWLNAFKAISDTIDALTLRKIGDSIPESADWPAQVSDIPSALVSIDVAYHLNHRKHGKVLMDLESGVMTEGIGHYAYAPAGDHGALMTCANPYPCEFDFGLIRATANKFKRPGSVVTVKHESDSCRKYGAESCSYRVSW